MALPPDLATEHALFLDFDGTLVDIAERPEGTRLDRGLLELLEGLRERLDGALAIVSGRPLQQIDAFLSPLRLAVGGQHGAELRLHPDAVVDRRQAASIALAVAELQNGLGQDERLVIEDKGASVSVHYRLAPQRAAECRELVAGLARQFGLEVMFGKMVAELRQPGEHKGRAVERLMSQPPFAGRTPLFVGDDTTDEDGFRGAAAHGGAGIKVGEGPTAAKYRLGDVAGVHAWLTALG